MKVVNALKSSDRQDGQALEILWELELAHANPGNSRYHPTTKRNQKRGKNNKCYNRYNQPIIEYKVACMYRCGMHCLSPVFMSKVIDDRCLHCRFSIFFTNSTTLYAPPCYKKTHVTLQGCFLRPNQKFRKTKPHTCSILSIARLESYLPSGSKNVNIEFSKILPQTRKIIDTRHSCAEKTIMEG